MHKRYSLAVLLTLCAALLGAVLSPATAATPSTTSKVVAKTTAKAPTYTRAQRLARANAIWSMSLDSFITLGLPYRLNWKVPTGIDATFDWSSDGCSVPSKYQKSAVPSFMSIFRDACIRHDFGYRNFGHGYYDPKNLALDPSNDKKAAVDARFKADMSNICKGTFKGCGSTAEVFYKAVAVEGNDAFTAGECTPGNLCLFEDDNYKDTRWMFSASHPSMDPYNFHDEADSLKNTSTVAWYVYSDKTYGGTSRCIAPGQTITKLDSVGLGDKIDSVKKSTATRC